MEPMRIAALVSLLALLPGAPAVAEFDSSKPFLCAITETVECGPNGSCTRGSAEDVNIPTFVWVDVPGGRLREHGGERVTSIGRHERKNGQLLLQGVQERAWSVSISEATGGLTATAAGDGFGFVLFGACTNP